MPRSLPLPGRMRLGRTDGPILAPRLQLPLPSVAIGTARRDLGSPQTTRRCSQVRSARAEISIRIIPCLAT
jgi:hypothetical protein